MRRVAAFVALISLTGSIHAQRPAIRWESAGGPLIAELSQVISQQGRLLLVGSGGRWWRSPDDGKQWDLVEERMPGLRILGANGRYLFGDAVDGVFRSTNVGDTWTRCGALPVDRRNGHEVTGLAAAENRVYVAILRSGLFRSDDDCGKWTQLEVRWNLEIPFGITYVDGSRVIVRAVGGPYLSIDAGSTWTTMLEGVAEPLAVMTGCDGTMIAGTVRGVFASRDSGGSWTLVALPGRQVRELAAARCNEFFAVVQDAGRWTQSVYRSINAGSSWTEANTGLSGHPIVSLSTDDRGAVYAAGSPGAFRWAQSGWQQFGPAGTWITSFATIPSGEVFAGADWIGLYRAGGPAPRWQKLLLGHDAHVSPHSPAGMAYVVALSPGGDLLAGTQQGILRSRDRGETWRSVGLTQIVQSIVSTKGGVLLAGTSNGIFGSSNDGASWSEHSLGLTSFRIGGFATAADGTVYVGTWDGEVYRSTDDGERWRPLGNLPGKRAVRSLLALPNGDLIAGGYLGFARWNGSSQTWQSVPLPTKERTALVRALVRDARGWIFAGTEGDGVLVSLDDGATWQAANDGLPVNHVLSFGVDAEGRLLAGTSAGVFRLQH